MRLLLGEEGQYDLALVAEETDEAVRFVGLVTPTLVLAFETASDSMSSVIWSSEGELSLIAAKPDKRQASTSAGT